MESQASIDGVRVTDLKKIPTKGGDVMHGLKKTDQEYKGFGELYFSSIDSGQVRGWKKHRKMTSNLIVVNGEVRFVLIDSRDSSRTNGKIDVIRLSPHSNYARLTIPPGIWVAFQGVGESTNLITNIADIEHDPLESEQVSIREFDFDWQLR